MTHLVLFEAPNLVQVNRGVVEMDIDPAAERYAVLDRRDMKPVMYGMKPTAGLVKFIVPFDYTTSHNLIAIILDDAGEPAYNAAVIDKITAAVVDAKIVEMLEI